MTKFLPNILHLTAEITVLQFSPEPFGFYRKLQRQTAVKDSKIEVKPSDRLFDKMTNL